MPRYGFSGQKLDMKKLILFILKSSGGPIDRQTLSGIATLDDNADYFLFSDAFAELVEYAQALDSENGVEILPRGATVAAIIERDVPSTLRRAVEAELSERRARALRDGCIRVREREENGAVYVDCELTDGIAPIMSLSLLVASREQAGTAAKSFRRKAEIIYGHILETMLKENE